MDKKLVTRYVFKLGLCGFWMVQTISDYVRKKRKLVGLRGITQKQGVGFPEMEK